MAGTLLRGSTPGQGGRQSTGAEPCPAGGSLALLKGREPKKPRSADMGDGCAGSTHDTHRRAAGADCARPAPGGSPPGVGHARRARGIACSVTSSQPSAPVGGGLPRGGRQSLLSSSRTPCRVHGVRSPLDGLSSRGPGGTRGTCSPGGRAADARRARRRSRGPRRADAVSRPRGLTCSRPVRPAVPGPVGTLSGRWAWCADGRIGGRTVHADKVTRCGSTTVE